MRSKKQKYDDSYVQFGFTSFTPCIQLLSDEKQEQISH